MKKWIRYSYNLLAETAFFAIYVWQSAKLMRNRMPKSNKSIVFTLDQKYLYRLDDGLGRYAYLILNAFCDAGYNVYLFKKVDTHKKYMALGRYGRFVYSNKNFKIISELPKEMDVNQTLYAFDTIHQDLLSINWKKKIYVNILWPAFCRIGEVIWKPYYFHPIGHQKGMVRKISRYRNNDRKLRIFFAGNANPKPYSQKKLRERYNKLTRHEGVTTALEMSNEVKTVINSKEFVNEVNKRPYINGCRMVLTNQTIRLKLKDYWNILSKSDFFLCLSGTDLPNCHNAVEAMSVGTIPIMEYNDWFFPALEHDVNAIIFSGKKELKKTIQRVLSMGEDEIKALRKNVIRYYEENLTNDRFIKNVESNKDPFMTIMQHPRLVCSQSEDEMGKQFMDEMMSALNAKEFINKEFYECDKA